MNKIKSWAEVFPFYLLALLPLLASCSEADDTVEEYANWQEKNEEAFMSVYREALASDGSQWKVLRAFTKADSTYYATLANPYDYVVAKIIENGAGTVSPLMTDTVAIHYVGRLLPSASYTGGYEFDQSYDGEYSEERSHPYAGITTGEYVVGFSTAIQHMHTGDHWLVYIPYQLGYGASGSGSIPGYSMLIFDLRLQDFWH